MTDLKSQKFWNKYAERYAARPLKNVAAYEAMLADAATRLRPTDRVLELGCGTGGTAIRLAPYVAQWIATDFSAEMVRISRAKPAGDNLTFAISDAETAFEAGPFDAICAFSLLHLVEDMPTTLQSIQASLRPGGRLICKTWCFADMRWSLRLLFRMLHLLGLFPTAKMLSEADLIAAIRGAGLEIVDKQVFGEHLQSPYFVARRPA